MTKVCPTISTMVELVAALLVEGPATPRPAVAPRVGIVAAVVEKAAITAERSPLPNPKRKLVIVLEEEVR